MCNFYFNLVKRVLIKLFYLWIWVLCNIKQIKRIHTTIMARMTTRSVNSELLNFENYKSSHHVRNSNMLFIIINYMSFNILRIFYRKFIKNTTINVHHILRYHFYWKSNCNMPSFIYIKLLLSLALLYLN